MCDRRPIMNRMLPALAERSAAVERVDVAPAAIVTARGVAHSFGANRVLDGVSLELAPGTVHALLGPNGAGKTTLLRILAGLLVPQQGGVAVLGVPPGSSRRFRRLVGLVPSGDRTFYLRISGLENLVFFARLHGMRRRDAITRAVETLEAVGLGDAAQTRVGFYSHGMQKRLAVARALLVEPPLMLVDEATHDLDPEGARTVRDLVASVAGRGTAVLWATQRLDEIRGFADRVTLLTHGTPAFEGTVPELMGLTSSRRYLVRLRCDGSVAATGAAALRGLGTLVVFGEPQSEHYLLTLGDDVVLGRAVAALTAAGVDVLACREERSELEEAFLWLAEGPR
jgi:ABC-2 type transport system ATP-binding protein